MSNYIYNITENINSKKISFNGGEYLFNTIKI